MDQDKSPDPERELADRVEEALKDAALWSEVKDR